MVVLTYSAFGDFIGSQSPYAQPYLGGTPPVGANVTLLPAVPQTPTPAGTTIRNNVDYVWDFPPGFPWDQGSGNSSPGTQGPELPDHQGDHDPVYLQPPHRVAERPRRAERVTACRHGRSAELPGVRAGDGAPADREQFQSPTPILLPVTPPGTGATAAPYQDLGTFIRDQTPFCTAPILDADTADRNTLRGRRQTGFRTCSAFSAAGGGPRLKSTSDNEMDAIQEQQCFHWDFAADYPPGPVPGCSSNSSLAPLPVLRPPARSIRRRLAGVPWLRNWQVSKAIRATYHSVELDPRKSDGTTITVGGEILVGFTGGGGM